MCVETPVLKPSELEDAFGYRAMTPPSRTEKGTALRRSLLLKLQSGYAPPARTANRVAVRGNRRGGDPAMTPPSRIEKGTA